ncbi:lantibiotic dehydratase C-terminal domain-containing protein [Deinococcus kurensis]|uniref:lantibiotic dehydratase C-terminal domain-containing protein n=1 Tax=Deinococcus kurensis TaxID=2662757 RepID=UPI0012D350EB|nr:lantibiotic dehydratase C-terminal domain-containing protein [Deinococcus kurensis]
MSGWLTAHLRWPERSKQAQTREIVRALHELAPEVRRWHYLWHADGGPHLRLRLCCRGEASRQRAWTYLRACAPGAERRPYRPEVWKFGGARHYPVHEEFFQCSSERALAVWGLHSPDARLRAAYQDTTLLLGRLQPAVRPAARAAMLAFAHAHLAGQPGVTRAAQALRRSPPGPPWQPHWPPDAPDTDPLGPHLQGLHLHLNRLGLGLRREALVYLAAGNPPATLTSGD